MIYKIIRNKDSKTWIIENPIFLRQDEYKGFYATNDQNASALYIDGQYYHITGRASIIDLEDVSYSSTTEDVYSNLELSKKLDEYSLLIDALLIAVTPDAKGEI